jgi:hypothetical protein
MASATSDRHEVVARRPDLGAVISRIRRQLLDEMLTAMALRRSRFQRLRDLQNEDGAGLIGGRQVAAIRGTRGRPLALGLVSGETGVNADDPSRVSVHCVWGKRGDADCNILRSIRFGGAVLDPLARFADDRLACMNVLNTVLVGDPQHTPEHDGVLMKIGRLPRFNPAAGTAHVSDADITLARVEPTDVFVDQFRLVACCLDPVWPGNQDWHRGSRSIAASLDRPGPRMTVRLLRGDSHDEITRRGRVIGSHDDAVLAGGFALEDNLGVGAAAAVIVFGELLAFRVLDTQPVVPVALAIELVGFACFQLDGVDLAVHLGATGVLGIIRIQFALNLSLPVLECNLANGRGELLVLVAGACRIG